MELIWYGHSCFRLSERGMASVVTDPYDHNDVGYDPLKLRADIVTISHDAPGHNNLSAIKGEPHAITGPGEFEIGGVFITGIQTNGVSQKNPEEKRNTLYVIEYNGVNVVHLGGLNRVPTQAEVEALGPVHVALVPIGGGSSLNAAKASEVISLLEPNIVIPMHYFTPSAKVPLDPLNKFLQVMGLTSVDTQPSLVLKTASSLPEETRTIVLELQNS
jgi:L-ascorbate metabolism protein UlaG (beta-lactamase superfamily)